MKMDPNRVGRTETTTATVEHVPADHTTSAPSSLQESPVHSNKSDSDYGSRDSLVDETGHNSVTPLLSRKCPASNAKCEAASGLQRNDRPTSLGKPNEPVSRQGSVDSQHRLGLSVRPGSKRMFTVMNYGQTDIQDCPPTPLSPTLSLDASSPVSPAAKNRPTSLNLKLPQNKPNVDSLLSNKISIASSPQRTKSVEPVLERRISIPATPPVQSYPPKKVSFDPRCKLEEPKQDSLTTSSFTRTLALVDVLRRGRIFARRKQRRLVFKNGEINFSNKNVQKKSLSYFLDMFTTLLDLKWRYIVFIFIMAFMATWIIFGIVWWSFVLVAKDTGSNDTESPCLDGVNDFATALLFSIETQHTIGYGTRSVTPDCPLAIGFVMLQSLVGVLLSCVMTGLIFAKFSRPKRRAETILFSKSAVICERDGERCLVFRVGDMRRTHMVSVNIRAMLIRPHTTTEREEVPFYQHNLHVQTESEDFFFLAWPIKVVHKIDKTSPLWKMSSEDLLAAEFEIVVVLEGTNQTTGQTTQVRTSYLPGEIMWGHRLNSLITTLKENNKYQVDYSRFNDTVPVNMSEESAQQFEIKKGLVNKNNN